MSRTVKVLVYGDVNLNVIDGSAIWLPSISEAWAKAGAEVHVQLKGVERRDLLSGPLRKLAGVRVFDAHPKNRETLTVEEAADAIKQLDASHDYDVILVRGIQAAIAIGNRPALAAKLWAYVTEYAYGPDHFDEARRERIGKIANSARFMLAQTEEARAVLENLIPDAAGKTLLLRPMVPDEVRPGEEPHNLAARGTAENPLRLIYTGKFAKAWRTDLMPALVGELEQLGVHAELTMVGDKVHNEPTDVDWADNMRDIMAAGLPRVTWAGAKDRATSLQMVADSDLLLSWRSPELDLSLEISTKVLESSALGVPAVINRTPMHEAIFGPDYPFFVDARTDTPAEIARKIRDALRASGDVSRRVEAIIQPYRISSRADELRGYLRRIGIEWADGEFRDSAVLPASLASPTKPLKVLLAGHDLKFAGELVDLLRRLPGVELRIDQWEALHSHNEVASQKALEWADVIICEWAGSNAVWYSRHKKPCQRLIVRLHMFEFRGRWLGNIATENVDLFVTVSELTHDLLLERLDVDASKVAIIPNTLSLADLQREPLAGREYRLGLVGFVPLLKRPDRALELLGRLREVDDRFTLHIRGRMPWEFPHLWQKPEQRESYLDMFAKLGASDLFEAVAIEPFGADMGSWFRKIGWTLSPSTTESFHLAPAEGMASGAVPVVWERPGAEATFGEQFLVRDTAEAAERILATVRDAERLTRLQADAMSAVSRFDEQVVESAWVRAITG
ncbi:glycosyltransferase family protein [Gulosibacter molinativorax]|uniref:Glycosyl transferase n=1 Tax=Gulosibacter molinativorax TaxID=256821 RepID=A0ABT7C6X8_9MICO|nr:glycosyltransferase [Gulosibacter molinativorax]MDJ1370944.1 glycosyl transferase [Gulosibacter molinativorax]QUY62734.1 Glycosyltransferase [Gulosibacter molinativorax]